MDNHISKADKVKGISKKRKSLINEIDLSSKKSKPINPQNGDTNKIVQKDSDGKIRITEDLGAEKAVTKIKEEVKVKSHTERSERQKSLYRPPTNEELNELRENENLYKNNIFRMQMSYLLEDVKFDEKKSKKVNTILHSLHEYLKTIPGKDESMQLTECGNMPFKTVFPIPEMSLKLNFTGSMSFQPPSDVKIIGSYLLKTMTKPWTCIDVTIIMPNACFQDRDYLNFKYHCKRAMYLCYLADYLASWEHTSEMTFLRKEGDPYKPSLRLKLKGKIGKCVSLRLLVSLPDGIFKLNRFSLQTDNIRKSWFYQRDYDEKTKEQGALTPHYNASILSDMLFETHLQSIYNAIEICEGMRDAICLFKVWLEQRSFQCNLSFNGFIGSMLMVYLLQKNDISAHMSSYQIFRMTLHVLATTDWTVQGLSMAEKEKNTDIEMFHKSYSVVFVDESGYLNLCANVNKVSYQMVRNEARLCMDFLDDSSVDGFDALFMKRINFLEITDHSFRLSHNEDIKTNACASCDDEKLADHGGDWTNIVVQQILSILEKGLNRRIKKLMFKNNDAEWATDLPPMEPSLNDVSIGFCLDTYHSENVLEMGPAAGTSESSEFREFWGAKCQLRRFADGSINEAVLWSCQNTEEKKMIPRQIIFHLLKERFGIDKANVTYHADQLNNLIKYRIIETKGNEKKKEHVQATGEEEARHFVSVFDELRKQIYNLGDLPLAVRSVDGIDAAFRLTEVSSPRQRNNADSDKTIKIPTDKNPGRWCPANKVVLQLESSGKWPGDLNAIQNIKAAFHLKLAECLQDQCSLPSFVNPGYVDVSKNGYVFRLMIADYREMIFCRENAGVGSMKRAFELRAKELDLLINKRTAHNNLINSLNGAHVGYAETTRLAKRWVAAQMMSPYVVDEAVELLVAHVFLSPAPLEAPRSHITGFIRFLKLVATYNWEYDPLIVNLNNQIQPEEISEFKEAFTSNRQQMADLHIITPYDKESSSWTKEHISKIIFKRLIALAAAAFNLITSDKKFSHQSAKQLFRAGLQDYDLIIKLKKECVPRYYSAVDTTIRLKPYKPRPMVSSTIPVNDFDPPMRYLEELQAAFSDIAMFFYDKYGGLTIGVVWKKHQMASQSFKILNAAYKKVSDTMDDKKPSLTSLVVPNVDAIVTDFKIMGQGLIDDITIHKQ